MSIVGDHEEKRETTIVFLNKIFFFKFPCCQYWNNNGTFFTQVQFVQKIKDNTNNKIKQE